MSVVKCLTVTIVLACLAGPVYAVDPTVDEIVEKANRTSYYQGKDGRATVKMTITDSQARMRERQFTILRWDEPGKEGEPEDKHCGDQKMYIYFDRPADVRKMVFMVWKHVEKDDDRWLYLPALDLVKRIAATDKRTSFVGSDFLYEDVSGRNINDDVHELEKTTDNYYVLKNTPKEPDSVEFSYYIAWISRDSFIPTSIEFFDRKGEKYREYKALNVEKIQEYLTVTKAQMKDLRTGSQTVLEYSDVTYDVGTPESVFSERYLRRAPAEYLR
jgi:outer membrane lipoprotein-sorting protein